MPQGELRRRDREMDGAESEQLLTDALVGRMGTVGPDGTPYVVPLNFAYEPARRTIFVHCALSGHLLENLAHSPLTCFEVDEPGEIIPPGAEVCSTSHAYRSVICFGRSQVVEEPQEKERALRLLVHKYVDRRMPERRYDPGLAKIDRVVVVAFQIERMTGKRRLP